MATPPRIIPAGALTPGPAPPMVDRSTTGAAPPPPELEEGELVEDPPADPAEPLRSLEPVAPPRGGPPAPPPARPSPEDNEAAAALAREKESAERQKRKEIHLQRLKIALVAPPPPVPVVQLWANSTNNIIAKYAANCIHHFHAAYANKVQKSASPRVIHEKRVLLYEEDIERHQLLTIYIEKLLYRFLFELATKLWKTYIHLDYAPQAREYFNRLVPEKWPSIIPEPIWRVIIKKYPISIQQSTPEAAVQELIQSMRNYPEKILDSNGWIWEIGFMVDAVFRLYQSLYSNATSDELYWTYAQAENTYQYIEPERVKLNIRKLMARHPILAVRPGRSVPPTIVSPLSDPVKAARQLLIDES